MKKENLTEQIEQIEKYINEVPKVLNPCGSCKNKSEIFSELCAACCYYYDSFFEIDKGNAKIWKSVKAANICKKAQHIHTGEQKTK